MTALKNLPNNIVLISLNGTVTKPDVIAYKNEICNKLKEQKEIGLLIDISRWSDMTGDAMAEDLKFEISLLDKLNCFPKISIVSDKQFIKSIIKIFQFFTPSIEIKLFSSTHMNQALSFLSDLTRKEPEVKSEVNLIETKNSDLFAYEIKGILTKENMEKIIKPLQFAFKEKGKLDLFARIDQYTGVNLKDISMRSLLELKLASLDHIRRYAIVGAKGWMKQFVELFQPLIPVKVRTFELKDEEQAWKWLQEK